MLRRALIAFSLALVLALTCALSYGVGGRIGFTYGYGLASLQTNTFAALDVVKAVEGEKRDSKQGLGFLDNVIDQALWSAHWSGDIPLERPWWAPAAADIELRCVLHRIAKYRRANPRIGERNDLDGLVDAEVDRWAPVAADGTLIAPPRSWCTRNCGSSPSSSDREPTAHHSSACDGAPR